MAEKPLEVLAVNVSKSAVTENPSGSKTSSKISSKMQKREQRYGGKTIADPARPGKFISQSVKKLKKLLTKAKSYQRW